MAPGHEHRSRLQIPTTADALPPTSCEQGRPPGLALAERLNLNRELRLAPAAAEGALRKHSARRAPIGRQPCGPRPFPPPPPPAPLAAVEPAFAERAVRQVSRLLPRLPSCVHHPPSCSMRSVPDLLAALPAQFRHLAPTAAAADRAYQLAHELCIARQQAGLSGLHGTQDARMQQ